MKQKILLFEKEYRMEKYQPRGRVQAMTGRRSVWVGPYNDTEDLAVQFKRPIRGTDFLGGRVKPTMVASRHKQSLVQNLRISKETAYVLWLLLDNLFNENKTDSE